MNKVDKELIAEFLTTSHIVVIDNDYTIDHVKTEILTDILEKVAEKQIEELIPF